MNKFNPEDQQLARILPTLIWMLWGMYLVVILITIFYDQDWNLIAVSLAASVLLVAAMLLLGRGRLRASSLLVVMSSLGAVTFISTVGQGIRDIAIITFPIIIVFAGLTLNDAYFRLCVGLAMAAVCWLALGENFGWFATTPFVGEMANWIYLVVTNLILLVGALAVDSLAVNMRKSLELARQEIAQRKQAEKREAVSLSEVKNSEIRFHALIEHGRDNISLLAADGSLLWESPTVNNILGYAPNQFVGHNIFELMHPEDQAWTSDLFAQIVQSPGNIQEGEFRLLHANGTWRWIECSATNLLDKPGLQAVVLNYRDITKRKQAEDLLEKSESKYRKMVETTNEGIIVLDHEMRMTLINHQMAAMLGYTTEELLGRKFVSLLFEADLDDHRAQMQARVQGQSAVYERCFRRKDGGRLWTLVSATATPDTEGAFDGAFGMITDITERKRMEDTLRENAIRYRTLLDNLPQLVWQRDLDSVFIDGNIACARALSTTVEALAGKTDYDFYPVELAEKYRADDRRVIENGAGETFEERFLSAGSERFARTTKVPLRDDKDKIYGTLGIAEDITERKQADGKIRATLEEKETLLREVHHRVKNNLQVIISLIKMRARLTQEEGTIQFLTELEGQAHTMALVYEQLYQSENLAQVNMAQYLRQLTSNVLDTYGRRDAIQFRLDASIAMDVAQATPCGLIVNELFSNILKYAFPPGFQGIPTVSITLRQDHEIYHLKVSDNGVGFPSGYDWRAGQSMGLRLVNLWVTHQLGGTLAVSGKPGTTFDITFDLQG